VFVTHDMPTAVAVCDRFCLLGEGRVLDERRVGDLNRGAEGPLEKFILGEYGG
jgi:ABC-type transporter Mla maintaining outer membrane lipid asymmetry ATPase subunit MlaF